MTSNQIAYWNLKETERSNRAKEAETHRSNRTKEYETVRHNVTQEHIDTANSVGRMVSAIGQIIPL